jgi:hypothetical protein
MTPTKFSRAKSLAPCFLHAAARCSGVNSPRFSARIIQVNPQPVRNRRAVGVVTKVVAVLGGKSIRPAGYQFVQPVMVCLNQTIVIEIVKGEAPDGLPNRVEFSVNVVVGAPEM